MFSSGDQPRFVIVFFLVVMSLTAVGQAQAVEDGEALRRSPPEIKAFYAELRQDLFQENEREVTLLKARMNETADEEERARLDLERDRLLRRLSLELLEVRIMEAEELGDEASVLQVEEQKQRYLELQKTVEPHRHTRAEYLRKAALNEAARKQQKSPAVEYLDLKADDRDSQTATGQEGDR